MPKQCSIEGCENPQFGGKMCKWHQSLRTDKKQRAIAKPKKIKFRSDKRAQQEKQYSIDRKEFLSRPENQWCRVYPWLPATQIHHICGREGDMLLDQEFWLPVSAPGHERIEMSPVWAKEMKYSLPRYR